MKYCVVLYFAYVINVALFTRAWIEIKKLLENKKKYDVALFTRAWIEIDSVLYCHVLAEVALFTRAWIEIALINRIAEVKVSRPLHEGVD